MHRTTAAHCSHHRVGSFLCLLAVAVLFLGCRSKEPDYDMTGDRDVDAINELVTDVARIPADSPDRLGTFFLEDSMPNEQIQARLGTLNCLPKSKPKITGNTATIEVEISLVEDGSVVGQATWTFEKVDGNWLIKEMPLP